MTVTPIFHLFFMHWRHYHPIWMSPSDYQSFIYFRAVSHKKEYIKVSPVTVFCRAFYWSQFVGWHLWHEFSVFLWRGCHPCHPSALRKKWIFISPSINNLLILDKKSNPFLPAFHFLFVILHPEKIRLIWYKRIIHRE